MAWRLYWRFVVTLSAFVLAASGDASAVADEVVDEPEASVKWICPRETFAEGMGKPRYYRCVFNVSPGLERAIARWWLDDVGEIFIDGQPVSAKRGSRIDDPADFTAKLVTPGRHCLAVRNANLAGMGGVCLAL